MSRVQDICWAAGLYEGEGYVQYNCKTERVVIGVTDKWVAERLQQLFGGKVYEYQSKKEGYSRTYIWRVIGPRARGFLMSVYLLLGPRRKAQIRSVLLHQQTLLRVDADKYKDK